MTIRSRLRALPRDVLARAGRWARARPLAIADAADRARARIVARPLDVIAVVAVVVVSIVSVVWPLFSTRYPPMTDLPMHAAHTGAFRHWFDPSYHFQDQFELQPILVPYDSSYVVGALLMLVFGATTAVKLATAIMLLSLPLGLGVLFWGMRKSPLSGVFGLPFVWCDLTHWGFVNFVSAIGQFALVLGLSLRAVDKPSRRTSVALAFALVSVFFTHIFRFPFAVAGALGAALVAYPATRRIRPIFAPLVPGLVLFALFYFRRAAALGGSVGDLHIEWKRVAEIPKTLVNGFNDPNEMAGAWTFARLLGAVELVAVAAWLVPVAVAFVRKHRRGRASATADASSADSPAPRAEGSPTLTLQQKLDARFTWLVTLVPLSCAAFCFYLFLTLPMAIGMWWYVYPREVVAACFIALAALPGLPKNGVLKLLSIAALSVGALGFAAVSARHYAAFGAATEDFHRIQAKLPRAPRLLYLVKDHSGAGARTGAPFLHLPAWIQAEKGGWLSFHFATWGTSPLKFRTDEDAIVAPPIPLRWEWTPERFKLAEHGAFFDWFLVRQATSPDALFRDDATIVRVAHEGMWWLYKRDLSPVAR